MSNSNIDLDAELSRFEKEIQSCTVAPNPPISSNAVISRPPSISKPAFIPNSIRRQMPTTQKPPTISKPPVVEHSPATFAQATFVPAISNSYQSGQNNHSTSTNYTAIPMEMPTNVHTVGKIKNINNNNGTSTSGGVVKAKNNDKKGNKKPKKNLRIAGGQVWVDPTLEEWDPNDFRIFCGDLGNDVSDDVLTKTFSRFPSFVKAKVVRDKKTNKSRGYGFVSFKDPLDFSRAIKEMDGKYVGSRPIKLRKSNWKDRNLDVVKQKKKMKQKLGLV